MDARPPRAGPGGGPDKAGDGLGALRRAFAVLKFLAQMSPLSSRLIDIASATGIPPSTIHRLLKGLAAEGMVLREAGGERRYKLGPFALGLGPDASGHRFDWFAEICHPSLERLARATGFAAHAAVRVGRSGLSLDLVMGEEPHHPAFAKSGAVGFIGFGSASVVLLAALPEVLAEEILWENDWLLAQAAIDRDRLLQLIGQARRDGYCYSERVFVPDLCAVSLCVPLAQGLPYAAISVLTRAERIPPHTLKVVLGHTQREADFIARQLQGRSADAQ